MNRLTTYFRQSWTELRKVVWPTRPVAIRYTIAVVIFSIILAIFIGLIDIGLSRLFQKVILKG